MARKRKIEAAPDIELPAAESAMVDALYVGVSVKVDDAGPDIEPVGITRRMTGHDVYAMLRQQRREARLKEKGY